MARICPSCGKELADNAKFCMGCGTAVPVTPEVEPIAPVVEPIAPVIEPVAAPPADKPKKNKKGLIIAIVAVIVAVALIITGVIVVPKLFGDDKGSSKPEKNTTEKATDEGPSDNIAPIVKTMQYLSKESIVEYNEYGEVTWRQDKEYSAPNLLVFSSSSSQYDDVEFSVNIEYDSNGKVVKYVSDSSDDDYDVTLNFTYTEASDGSFEASTTYQLKETRWYEDWYGDWVTEEILVSYNVNITYHQNGIDGKCEITSDYENRVKSLEVSDSGKTYTYNYSDTNGEYWYTTVYTYDSNGNCTSISTNSVYGTGATNYEYNENGDLIREENLSNGSLVYEYDYTYDGDKLVEVFYGCYDDEYMGREKTTTKYTYNSDGLLTGVEQITDGVVIYKDIATSITEDLVKVDRYTYYGGESLAGTIEYQYEDGALLSKTIYDEYGYLLLYTEYDSLGREIKIVEYTGQYDNNWNIIDTRISSEHTYEYSEIPATKNYYCFSFIEYYFS